MNLLVKESSRWWHIVSQKGIKSKNSKSITLPSSFFSNSDKRRKFINALTLYSLIRSSYYQAKKNFKKLKKSEKLKIGDKVTTAREGYFEVTSSFINSVGTCEFSTQVVNKKLNQLVKAGFFEKESSHQIIFSTDGLTDSVGQPLSQKQKYDYVLSVYRENEFSCADNFYFKKVNTPIFRNGVISEYNTNYSIFRYNANKIRLGNVADIEIK